MATHKKPETTGTFVGDRLFHWADIPVDTAFADAHNQRMMSELEESVQRLQGGFDEATNDEKFTKVNEFLKTRWTQALDHDNGGDGRLGRRRAFEALSELSTESLFTKRHIEWAMTREAHGLLEGHWGWLRPSQEDSDKDAWLEYEALSFYDPAPEGVQFVLSDEGYEHLEEHPTDKMLLDFCLQKLNENPRFGDSDYYPPSPYKRLLKPGSQEGFVGGERELAIETAYLFGLDSANDVSEAARTQLFHVGVNLDEITYGRIGAVVGTMDNAERVVFAEAFLATEFGDDLGEQIIQLVEHDQDQEALAVQLGRIRNILDSMRHFTTDGFFAEVDKDLADDIRRGVSTRASEILFALNQRLDKGKSIEKAEVALATLEEWSCGVAEMLQEGVPQRMHVAGNTKLYHFINPKTGQKYPGAVELTTNGKAVDDASLRERYIKEGRGARISLTYDEAQPEVALSLNGTVRRGAMNGRLDKSVYNIVTNTSEPDADHAEISFDIASIHASADSRSRLTAEVIGEGSAIRDTGHGKKGGAKNFTYDIIGQDWGNREKFADAVRRFGDLLDNKSRTRQVAIVALRDVAA